VELLVSNSVRPANKDIAGLFHCRLHEIDFETFEQLQKHLAMSPLHRYERTDSAFLREDRIAELTQWGREIVAAVRSYPSEGLKGKLTVEALRRFHCTRDGAASYAEVVLEVLRYEFKYGEI
jgi:hypothetical protein